MGGAATRRSTGGQPAMSGGPGRRSLVAAAIAVLLWTLTTGAGATAPARDAAGPSVGSRAGASSTGSVVPPAGTQAMPLDRAAIRAAFGRLPLAFEANRGQADAQVQFLARGIGYTL